MILSGGPESVHEEGSPRAPQAIFDSGVPVLGICYGQMTMAAQLGGEVEGGHAREFGRADVEVKGESRLFDYTWAWAKTIRCGSAMATASPKCRRGLPWPASRRTRRSR